MSVEAMQVCQYANLLESGVMPTAGGWRDQSAHWVDAIKIVLREKARYRELEEQQRQRQAR